MELRVYYRRKSVERRLNDAGIMPDDKMNKAEWGRHWGPFLDDDKNHVLVYCTLITLTEELPILAKGLKIVKIILHANLALEQNRHIKQGRGKHGESRFEVEFGAEKFHPPVQGAPVTGDVYRAIISIWVFGDNLQSVKDCYEKIRAGELGGSWKGECTIIKATTDLDEI